MRVTPVLDVSGLPTYAYGHRSILWWGTLVFCLIEATGFGLAVMAYFYLRSKAVSWPPNLGPPQLIWGTVNTVLLLASCLPNHWVKKAAEEEDLRQVRIWLLVCLAFGVAFTAVRWLEFPALGVEWDTNAYGSVVWMLMALHTTHIVTDVADTAVLTALMFTRRGREGKRFVDVSENAFYWYFVVLTWLPIYAVVYLVPRFL
ncbi:MAG TPA: cytochrome c oxidase subunit 3 [Stellaceae bacterium]|jgi:heme/copper-type cytochrome/quinol oxidase subunit 3